MNRLRSRLVGLLATSLIPLGCEGGKPPVDTSNEEATVTGTVTIRGKLADRGEVTFDPANYYRKDVAARRAAIGKDGTYTVTTLVGDNQVSVSAPALQGRDSSNTMVFTVQSGQNTFNIVLPPGGAAETAAPPAEAPAESP